jgi:hypothetical protein
VTAEQVRSLLIECAGRKASVAVRFTSREGLPCVATGRPVAVDAKAVRLAHTRNCVDPYTVILIAITEVEEFKDPPIREAAE